MVEYFASA